jgi:hypothetical protein
MTKRQWVFRIIGGVAGWVLVVAGFWYTILDDTYVSWKRQPTLETGYTVAYPVKGIVVYIRKSDEQTIHVLNWIMLGSGSVLAISLVVSGEARRILNGGR